MKKFLIIITLIFLNANLGQAETSIPDCECNKIKNNINIDKKAQLQPQTSATTNNKKEIKEQTQKAKKSWWRFW